MREFLEVIWLAMLQATNLTLAGFGAGLSSAANHIYIYWRRCASRHDEKYTKPIEPDDDAVQDERVFWVSDKGTN